MYGLEGASAMMGSVSAYTASRGANAHVRYCASMAHGRRRLVERPNRKVLNVARASSTHCCSGERRGMSW